RHHADLYPRGSRAAQGGHRQAPARVGKGRRLDHGHVHVAVNVNVHVNVNVNVNVGVDVDVDVVVIVDGDGDGDVALDGFRGPGAGRSSTFPRTRGGSRPEEPP